MSEEKKDLKTNTQVQESHTEDQSDKDVPIQHLKRVAVAKGPDMFGLYFVGFSAGGEMPKWAASLRYTSRVQAERAAEEFNKTR